MRKAALEAFSNFDLRLRCAHSAHLSRAQPSVHADALNFCIRELSCNETFDSAAQENSIDYRDKKDAIHNCNAANLEDGRRNKSEE